MARLTAAKRRSLPKSVFAGPGRSYPVDTPARAVLAKAMATRFASPGERARIDAKANAKLQRNEHHWP
jgi:hypothetical protein